jgi:uncharacterized protein YndB with AHSA1/START domain
MQSRARILIEYETTAKLRSKPMAAEPVVVERVFDAPIADVWKAITDKEGFKHWFFEIPEFEPVVGAEFQFVHEHKDFKYVHLCRVKEVVPEKTLAYSWRYGGYEGDSLVTIELIPDGNKTRLKLTHSGLETFPPLPTFARENFMKGWTDIVGSGLKSYVERQGKT